MDSKDRRTLVAGIKAVLLITVCLALLSCSSLSQQARSGVCRNTAVYCAQLFAEVGPAEVAVGQPRGELEKHMQARAYLNGKWEWLIFRDGDCYVGEQEHEFEYVVYMSVMETIKYLEIWFPNLDLDSEDAEIYKQRNWLR